MHDDEPEGRTPGPLVPRKPVRRPARSATTAKPTARAIALAEESDAFDAVQTLTRWGKFRPNHRGGKSQERGEGRHVHTPQRGSVASCRESILRLARSAGSALKIADVPRTGVHDA